MARATTRSEKPKNRIQAIISLKDPLTGRIYEATALPMTLSSISGTPVNGYHATIATTPGTSILAAPGAGLSNFISDLTITNTGTVSATVTLTNGSGGSVLDTFIIAASATAIITMKSPYVLTAALFAYSSTGSIINVSVKGVQASSTSTVLMTA